MGIRLVCVLLYFLFFRYFRDLGKRQCTYTLQCARYSDQQFCLRFNVSIAVVLAHCRNSFNQYFHGFFSNLEQAVLRFVVWITGVLLYFSAIPAMNSGYLFMLLLAFYVIPFQLKPKKELDYFINRVVLFTCVLQLYFVYVFSALFKVTSVQWLSGDALYYTFLNDRYSPTFLKSMVYYMPFGIIVFLAYFIMIFQLFFPLWSQWKRTRKAALWIGVLMHLWIAFVMHLWDFAFAMLIPYYLFVRTEDRNTEEDLRLPPIVVETYDYHGNTPSV